MESYGPIRIATNVHPRLIRRPVRESVTWALESQEVSPITASDHKAARNRQDSIIKTNMKEKLQNNPQKAPFRTVSKITAGLSHVQPHS